MGGFLVPQYWIGLNDDIVNMEKPDGMYAPSFVVDEGSGLF